MRLRLLRRRLTVSAPRMAVRSALPWTLRWLVAALVLGFSAALAVWAFEFGKEIAGLEKNAKIELAELRQEAERLRQTLGAAQSVANTSESLLTAERAAQQELLQQIKALQSDNQALRSDLGFFERLLPGAGSGGVSIRGLQAERLAETQIRWQLLAIQADKNPANFKGRLEITLSGTLNGAAWRQTHSAQPQAIDFERYLRLEGLIEVPPKVKVNTISAKISQGATVRAIQSNPL